MTARGRLVLIGAGHAHLHVLANVSRLVARGHDVVVVAPGRFWYSGLATGMLGGRFDPADDQVDVARLAERSGCRHLDDEVASLDPDARRIRTRSGRVIDYDAASVSIGSEVKPLAGQDDHAVFAAKPIARLASLRAALERGDLPGRRILVVGGGRTGCELAANLAALERRGGRTPCVTLVAADEGGLAGLGGDAAGEIRRALEAGGVRIRTDGPVLRLERGRAILADGAIGFDVAVNATGLRPPRTLGAFGLALDASGALRVDRHLRSVSHPSVHGAGDCIAFPGATLPQAGVYAVRQGPVLRHNLLAALEGRTPIRFRPQRRYLWIMNLGDGTGLASYGPLHCRSRLALRVKDWIDQRFVRRFAG